MGTISLQIPVSGQPNSTEDPKIASDFTTVQTVINGNIDTNNISPTAGITATQLAASAQFGGSVQLTFAAPCRVYKNSAYTHPGTGYANINADTKVFDPGVNYSTGTFLYTCPATGYYQVNGQVRWNVQPSSVYVIAIFKNGAVQIEGNTANAGFPSAGMTVGGLVSCTAGDTLNISIYCTDNTATLLVNASGNYMSVVRVA